MATRKNPQRHTKTLLADMLLLLAELESSHPGKLQQETLTKIENLCKQARLGEPDLTPIATPGPYSTGVLAKTLFDEGWGAAGDYVTSWKDTAYPQA